MVAEQNCIALGKVRTLLGHNNCSSDFMGRLVVQRIRKKMQCTTNILSNYVPLL